MTAQQRGAQSGTEPHLGLWPDLILFQRNYCVVYALVYIMNVLFIVNLNPCIVIVLHTKYVSTYLVMHMFGFCIKKE